MDRFDDEIPPLRRPEKMPPVQSQSDLHRHWRALMGELGFTRTRLYVQFVLRDGRVAEELMEIDELPDIPDPAATDQMMECFRMLLTDVFPEDTGLALLFARPGPRGPNRADRAWAQQLTAAARRASLPMWQVHVANDEQLHVMAPDDLVEPA